MSDVILSPEVSYEELKRPIMRRHLEQLQGFPLVGNEKLSQSPMQYSDESGGGFEDLKKWSQDSMEQIRAAKENCELLHCV
jgi:hypothetical protein